MESEKIVRYSVKSEEAEIYAKNIRMEKKKSVYNVGAFQNSGYFKNAKNFQKELSKIVDRTKLFYKDDK